MIVSASALHGSHDPRTIRATRLLEGLPERGFDVQLLSLWAGEGEPPVVEGVQTVAVRASDPFAEPDGWFRRLAARTRRRLEGDPGGLMPWARAAAREVAALAEDDRPELIYAIAYPVDALIAAAIVADRIGVPWMADLGDPWDPPGLIERRRRRRTLSSAAALVTTNGELAGSLAPDLNGGVPILLSPAGGKISRRPPPTDGVPLIVHMGSINAGRVDPRPAFEVLSAAHRSGEIEFRSHTNGWHPELDTLPHVHLPMLAPDQALELTAEAAAALVLGNQNTIQVPSKAYEIACTETWGLCVSELDEDPAVRVLSATGHAVAADNDVESIRRALTSVLEKERRGERPKPATEHDWDRRIDDLEDLIGSVLG